MEWAPFRKDEDNGFENAVPLRHDVVEKELGNERENEKEGRGRDRDAITYD